MGKKRKNDGDAPSSSCSQKPSTSDDYSVSFVKSEEDDVATTIRDKTASLKSNATHFSAASAAKGGML
ncbi:hypothetical protein B9Z55_000311 [Caenorhabditis nigoni]|nr:hypothetical protein B9Z55_000311 [Caenorhabditis nigoni]